ncbi:MAG: ATP-binding protein [Mangrovibacterium sp.]
MLSNIHKEIDFLMQSLASASVGTWFFDFVGEKLYINECFSDIFELNRNRLIQFGDRRWFEVTDPVLDPFILMVKAKTEQAGGESFNEYYKFSSINNGDTVLLVKGKQIGYKENGTPSQTSGILYNITDRFDIHRNMRHRIQIEKLVAEISSDFIDIQLCNLDETLVSSLQKIGEFAQIDRSYVFLLSPDETRASNTHEWCNQGINPEKENLQNIPCSAFPWWMSHLKQHKHIFIYNIEELPPEAEYEKQILESQQIKSVLVVPMLRNETVIGFMGFDSVHHFKSWSLSDIELLFTVANTFSHAIEAKHNNELMVAAKEKAEESNRVKSAFLATINHELRTPLHHILGFSDLMKDTKLKKEQIELYASKIHESGKNLLQIVEDILSLANGNPSEVRVRAEVVHGVDLFVQHKSYMSEILATANREKDIVLNFYPSRHFLNSKFITDKNKINQILINLFKNAVKFTRKGTIDYEINLQNNQLELSVKDNGIGIPMANRDIIFEYFRQGDDTTTRQFHGIGIGLSICKNLVQILGGNIRFESEVDKGSNFIVTIPVAPDTMFVRKQVLKLPVPDYTGFCILIADEDPVSSAALKNLLTSTQARILTAGSYAGVLSQMDEGIPIDITILNIRSAALPVLDLIRQLHVRHGKKTIIALSANSMPEEREKIREAGGIDLLIKPVNARLLFKAINKGLKRKATKDLNV